MPTTDDIPIISVDVADSETNVDSNKPHDANASLLSPLSVNVPSVHYASDDAASSTLPPPSPTFSHVSSVQFRDSTALRDNNPEETRTHSRRPSFTSDVSTVSGYGLDPSIKSKQLEQKSSHGSVYGEKDDGASIKKKGKKKAKSEEEEKTTHELELEQDRGTNPYPFAFRPYELAHMLDPKSFETVEKFGGTAGILQGLGTDANRGLSKEALTHDSGAASHHSHDIHSRQSHSGGDPEKGAGEGASHSHDASHEKHPAHGETEPDPKAALSASVDERRRIYGPNLLPTRSSKTLLQLMWLALKDKVLVLLSIAAVISLALGLFQDFGTPREPGEAPVDWVEGVAIMVAVGIVVIVGSINDWQKERQFKALNDKKEERGVKVIRDGIERVIDIKEVVAGDIALLEPGEIVPCDGIFLSGHNVRCDESGATGESDAIRKVSYEECMELKKNNDDQEVAHTDCFVVSGSKVLEGVGRYVVVAVGTKSFNGRLMMALRGDTQNTPLQNKLVDLAELIAKIGSAAGALLFAALLIRFFVQLGTGEPARTASQKGIAFVNILIISVTVIVVAVPEGLPLAVTLALAFATKRMTYEKLLVRVLSSCETMANASVVCTDKTGTLTQNDMTVVAGSIGIHCKFVRQLEENEARTNADGRDHPDADKPEFRANRRFHEDFSIDQNQLNTVLSPALQELFNEAVAVNSTAFEDEDPETHERVFIGSKTETALLKFAKDLKWRSFRETRDAAKIVQMIPFSSERKAMGVVVELPDRKGYRVYLKGASEILSKTCRRHVVVTQPGQGHAGDSGAVQTKEFDELAEENISRTIIFYANQTLRTIALCYRDFTSWPPQGMHHDETGEVPFGDLAQDLTLIGITGIEDPLRDGVRDAVVKCHRAGVQVKMCTGDNVLTARSIATQCGIFSPGGIIMEGPVFRKLSKQEKIEIAPRLQVLARSSPEDKKILVETLKSLGEIVGVTGDGTNDGPALKTANVGFSMGIAGTEVAKEASDIILMDDNFASIVKAIIWGRCVNDSVRKFLQFQLSTNVTAVIITFVSAVASDQEESVLSAVQLLWINIIMDTFAALALATDPASESLLDRKPDRQTAPLFNTDMYKQILIQSIYQVTVILIFHFLGWKILGFHTTGDALLDKNHHMVVQTLVFNAFVFAQIFNSINSRRLDRKLNIFEGIHRNTYFITITLIEIAAQILIVFVGGAAFTVTRIGGREWGISLALGFVSIPLGALIRLLPNEPFEKLFKMVGLLGKDRPLLPTKTEKEPWNDTIDQVRQGLGMFTNIRGGRLRSSSVAFNAVKERLTPKKEDQQPPLSPMKIPTLMTLVPSLIVGSVASGFRTQGGSLSDPAHSDPSKSSAALWEGKLQLHPDTPHDDPAYVRFGPGNQNNV